MNFKNIKHIVTAKTSAICFGLGLTLCATPVLTSCSTDDLDIEQRGVLTTNEYKTANDSEMKQFLAAVYAGLIGDSYEAVLMGQPASWRAFQYELNRMGAETANYYAYTETADANTYKYIWSYFYRTCYWCSMIIENAQDNNVCSADVKNRVIAEARAIRAIQMMYIVQLYGNAPLANKVLDGTEGNTPASESWAFIESELTAAAEVLPTKSGLGGQSEIGGRLTKEACYAYLGKAQLWQKKYDEAVTTLDKVISSKKYALYDDYATYNSAKSDFADENIWEFDFNEDPANNKAQEGAFDLCCFAPAVSYWWDGVHGSLLLTFGMGGNASADFVNFLAQHDEGQMERMNADVMEVCAASMSGMVSNPISECDGYYKMKDVVLAEDLVGELPYYYSTRNTVFMRYSEVLLNYAEACLQSGKQGSISAAEAVNIVRNRSGLSSLTTVSLQDVKDEDRAEFYGEGHRFIDLVRWGDAPTVLKDCGKELYTCTLGTPFEMSGITMYFSKEVTSSNTGGKGFQADKNELFPIPQSEINQNPSITQNTGW